MRVESLSAEREIRARFAPAEARAWARALPMPVDAPVWDGRVRRGWVCFGGGALLGYLL